MRWKRRARRVAVAGAACVPLGLLTVVALAHLLPLPSRLASTDSTVVNFRDGSTAHVFLSPDDKWRVRVRLEDVDPRYVDALLRLEDRRFWSHDGVDPTAIVRAAASNLMQARVVSGASTITMQLARLLEPRPRTLASKAVEAFRSVQLELRLGKRRILEHYLRFTPYGRNVEGIQAASLGYFGHRADALSAAEVATLLAVPQGPASRAPRPSHTARLRAARDDIAARLGLVADLDQVRSAAVPERFRPFPRHARHAAWWLRPRVRGDRIETTLDRGLQAVAESLVARHASRLGPQGVHNAAVVLLEHETGAVRALVGNVDFDDGAHGGQIPAFAVPRSPGSALKPLLYALAIDRGLALPGYRVADVPTRYPDYVPANYDGAHAGLVRLEEALSRSLNVPFVRLLGRLGVERLLGALRSMDARHLVDEPGYYGLSLAVGGVELTPLELAGVYGALAGDGRFRAPHLTGAPEAARPALSAGAAWLTRRALRRRDRPDFPTRRRVSGVPASIHWKTGTSAGHRDAWAAGSGPRHTAVVWVGNLDRTPSAALVGADAAAPLLFDLLEAVSGEADRTGDPRPGGLVAVEVCAWSGYLVGDACEQTERAWAPVHAVPTERDPYHVKIEVDVATGEAVDPSCRAGRQTATRVFRVHPPAVRDWLALRGHPTTPLPVAAAGCTPSRAGGPPAILSPPPRSTIRLIPGLDLARQSVAFAARSQRPGERLSWFVDGAYVGQAGSAAPVWWVPARGDHEVVVVDGQGRSATRRLRVRALD